MDNPLPETHPKLEISEEYETHLQKGIDVTALCLG